MSFGKNSELWDFQVKRPIKKLESLQEQSPGSPLGSAFIPLTPSGFKKGEISLLKV